MLRAPVESPLGSCARGSVPDGRESCADAIIAFASFRSRSYNADANRNAGKARSPRPRPLAPSGSIPTSAQVQAAGAADPAAAPDGECQACRTCEPNGVNASQPNLAPKYNVSLIGQRNVGSGLDFYSLDREMALGRQLSQEVESSAKLVTDPVINEYVNRIGQNLVRNSDARVPFTIKVLDNDEVNAFALARRIFLRRQRIDSGCRQRSRTRRRDGARDRARGRPSRHQEHDAGADLELRFSAADLCRRSGGVRRRRSRGTAGAAGLPEIFARRRARSRPARPGIRLRLGLRSARPSWSSSRS